MDASEPLWDLQNSAGLRTLCYVRPLANGRYLLIVERDGAVIVSEHHDVPRTAIDRSAAICSELVEQGWTAASGRA